ncbi:MAG: hypothetical protein ACUVR0_07980 [Candidatus Aminicenantales bacterium]
MLFLPTFVDNFSRLSLSVASHFQGKMSRHTLLACFLDILPCYGRDLSSSASRTYRALPGALPLFDQFLAEFFSPKVFALLLREELISEAGEEKVVRWRYSGFSVHSKARAQTCKEAEASDEYLS